MIDLGTLEDGFVSIALDINESGQVTGIGRTALGEPYTFLWQNGTMKILTP